MSYDSLILVSFGGPEGPDDVMPFLEKVTRGRVPRERLLKVAEHYHLFGGISPINGQNRQLLAALKTELSAAGMELPIYFGNRNWHPFLTDTIAQMIADGRRHALAIVTSAFSSYSGCRAYLEDIAAAQRDCGERAPRIDKLRGFFNHPGFIETNADNLSKALSGIEPSCKIVFTAHSIPETMAAGCRYQEQLMQACAQTVEKAAVAGQANWRLAFQSRSGSPSQPWLEPDILDVIDELHAEGVKQIVVHPIGFVSDHMEVIYDLDVEALDKCKQLGMQMVRVASPGIHPRFVTMIRELIEERLHASVPVAVGELASCSDACSPDCCASGAPPVVSGSAERLAQP